MSRISRDIAQVIGRNGTFPLEGEDGNPQYGWKDMTADLGGRGVGATAPTWATFRDGIQAQQFAKGDEVQIAFHPNHDVIPGTLFYPHIHWTTNSTTSSGTVVWCMELTMAEGFDQEAFPASTTIEMTYTFTANKQYQHFITECSDAQAFTMPDVDSLILMRIYRKNDAADTFAGNVFGLTADLHYRCGKFSTIGKRPNFNEYD
jgi:hypothetical protein